MEEDDHDELLQCTDDESLSETEDQCLPLEKPEDTCRSTLMYFNHTKWDFITTKISLILSTALIIILLPLYLESVNVRGDAYSMILFISTALALSLISTVFILQTFCSKFKNVKFLALPLRFHKLLQLAIFHVLSAFMVVYALDRKRVLCHLQDPIKGVILVFSLLYYFFFCKKLMGLQRIFSATTIIVGLFIAVDYGLCDEFKCRGYERERVTDDTGNWNWRTHSIWTAVYIVGLAMFAAYFTVLERVLLASNEIDAPTSNPASSFLTTVSSSVSYPSTNTLSNGLLTRGKQSGDLHFIKRHSVFHVAMWIHIFSWVGVVAFFWVDFMPEIGKGSDLSQFWNYTINGILCHFTLPVNPKSASSACGNVVVFGWPFMFWYLLFVVSAIKFLILSQSAVYTVATMTASLPLVGIWWSLVHMTPIENGLVIWAPSVTGELICSLLGLPIIFIGLCLLCKSHFKDYQWSRLATTHVMSSSHLA